MEVQILRFFSKVFNFFLILFFISNFYLFYIFWIKNIKLNNEFFLIKKNQSNNNILEYNLNENVFDLFFYNIYLKAILLNDIKIHYGKFKVNDNNFLDLVSKITSPSIHYEKITIVEGWSKNNLNIILNENFKKFHELKYSEIIADTYYVNYGLNFRDFKENLNKNLNDLKEKYKNNKLLKKYSFNDILIIGSLLEKEGLDYNDKKKIFSVIINRLNKKMKLQIDATVIYSLTKGKYNLDRKLTYKDLKIKNRYNTYYIYGLPPSPISYVGLKTIELIFENYKSNYLFYFYNKYENKHIYSMNYKEHLQKLNEYRSK